MKKYGWGGKEHWGERFSSSEEVRASFIEVVIFGWTLENVFPNGEDPRNQREEIGK